MSVILIYVNGIILPTKIFLLSDWLKILTYLKTQLLREVENKQKKWTTI